MKNTYKVIAIVLFVIASLSVTNQVRAQKLKYCGLLEATEELYKQYPDLQAKVEALEKEQEHVANRVTGVDTVVYIIPIVFHIIHNYGGEDISDAQVIDAVRILNLDYRKLNADTSIIVPQFVGLAADARIQFRLAQLDPNGVPTDGIDRIFSATTNAGGEPSKLNQWDPHKYLNVWTTATIGSAGVAGYSQYPSVAQFRPQSDGVLILSNYIGSIGTSSPTTSRALTHEIGHFLNLQHPWGNNNQPGVACGDDQVTDTPVTKGWTTCNLTTNAICTPGVHENVQNYMDYSYCSNMFTIGQVARMRAALTSNVAGRNNLWSPGNLGGTGVLNKPPLVPKPVADFITDKQVICKGGSITFTDYSWKGTPTSWKWILPGSQNGTYTTQNPSAVYDTVGTFDAKLVAQNSAGMDSVVKTSTIYVYPTVGVQSLPYNESFEGSQSLQSRGWNVIDFNKDNFKWAITNGVGYTGSNSLSMLNYAVPDSLTKDIVVSPGMDFTSATGAILTFRYAYARKKSYSGDILKVTYSTNCGASWSPLASIYSNSLATVTTPVGTPFQPSSTQWKLKTLNFSAAADGKSDVMIKFEFTSGLNGNNLFIDDINVYPSQTSLSVNNQFYAEQTSANIYPNPVNGNESAQLYLDLPANDRVTISIYDIMGKKVKDIAVNNALAAGEHTLDLSLSGINAGLYLVKVQTSAVEKHIKLLVN